MSHDKMTGEALLQVRGLKKHFGHLEVLNGIDIDIHKGEVVAVIGPSGSGKSTFIRCLNRLEEPTAGEIIFEGEQINSRKANIDHIREKIGMVFQNFNLFSNMTVMNNITAAPINVKKVPKEQAEERALTLLDRVGLKDKAPEYPVRLSGGQRQRIGIARAIILKPEIIICDEPVSALDVSIQAQILNMLVELQKELGLSLLFISHDIGVVRFISDRIGVMYLGTLMEETETEELFEHPLHPYTEALFEAVPDPYIKRKELKGLSGEQPVRTEDFKGCAFYTRCPYATDCCKAERPELREVKPGHKVACHRYNND